LTFQASDAAPVADDAYNMVSERVMAGKSAPLEEVQSRVTVTTTRIKFEHAKRVLETACPCSLPQAQARIFKNQNSNTDINASLIGFILKMSIEQRRRLLTDSTETQIEGFGFDAN
jgi:hypothetical protein